MSTARKTPASAKKTATSQAAPKPVAAKAARKAAPVAAPEPAARPARRKAAAPRGKGTSEATATSATSAATAAKPAPGALPAVRVGIGGWTYEPWRGSFYPAGLAHAKELQHASRQLTAIEVNGTYYSTFKPATFAKWRDETPEGFVFSLKASRFSTNRKLLGTASESIDRFIDSGIEELGDKLGPIVWQFMPTKVFEPGDFEAFLALLPNKAGSRTLQHVMDVRHPSFLVPEYQSLARRHGVSTVFTDAEKFPSFDEPEGEIAYARLMRASADEASGYAPQALKTWASRAQAWAEKRPTYVFFINGAKEKAPAAAGALLRQLEWKGWAPTA